MTPAGAGHTVVTDVSHRRTSHAGSCRPSLELFCQIRAKPTASDLIAFVAAGYKSTGVADTKVAIARLLQDSRIATRIAEIKAAASSPPNPVTREAVIERLTRIAFFDPLQVVNWVSTEVRVDKDEISGVRRFVNVPNFRFTVTDSAKLDADTVAAMPRIKRYANGGFSINFQSPMPALIALGKHLGMWPNNAQRRAQGNGSWRHSEPSTSAPRTETKEPRSESFEEWTERRKRDAKAAKPAQH